MITSISLALFQESIGMFTCKVMLRVQSTELTTKTTVMLASGISQSTPVRRVTTLLRTENGLNGPCIKETQCGTMGILTELKEIPAPKVTFMSQSSTELTNHLM